MTIDEYKKRECEINEEYINKLHLLRMDYVNENKKFDIGDFVYNVTGIIKVERITYEMFSDNIEITYIGHRYKKNKGKLSRTKEKNTSSMWESDNLKLC